MSTVAIMAENAAAIAINHEINATAANAQAYICHANEQTNSVLQGNSLLIEPSQNGISQPPTGEAAATTSPESAANQGTEAPGENPAPKKEGTDEKETLRSLRWKEENFSSDKIRRSMADKPHIQQA